MSAAMFNPADFILRGEDDFARVDAICRDLLHAFYRDLLDRGMGEAEATPLASGADYFVRDFLVDNRRMSPFDLSPLQVRQFAATWYIINTVEPTRHELERHLAGIDSFCAYLAGQGFVAPETLAAVSAECGRGDYFARRIESFWGLEGDGYCNWEAECTLKL